MSINKLMGRNCFDVILVGGGIIGTAAARQLKLIKPSLNIALVEKENEFARHQSGHNSGVLHAGIYYTPGSLKAKLCVEGIDLLYDYLDQNDIPYKKCGKLIVSVEQSEVQRLEALFDRATKNGCKGVQIIEGSNIPDIEPFCRGLKAIFSPHTGIVDYSVVTKRFATDFKDLNGEIFLNWELAAIEHSEKPDYPIKLIPRTAQNIALNTKFLIACAGLHSDSVAKLSGCSQEPKILPVRGEYLRLTPEKRHIVKGNIYPVPDPSYPFLGVHFTPTIDGEVLLGPNAMVACKKEGYARSDFAFRDFCDLLRFRGTRKLIAKNISFGMNELRYGLLISTQVKRLQKYIPSIRNSDVQRGRCGIRAQAIDSV